MEFLDVFIKLIAGKKYNLSPSLHTIICKERIHRERGKSEDLFWFRSHARKKINIPWFCAKIFCTEIYCVILKLTSRGDHSKFYSLPGVIYSLTCSLIKTIEIFATILASRISNLCEAGLIKDFYHQLGAFQSNRREM